MKLKSKLLTLSSAVAMALTSASFAADGLSQTDKSFVKKASEGGLFEVQGSQLAQTKSSTAAVKSFADRMITDHTKAGSELGQIASSKGITVPSDPSIAQRSKLKALGLLDGPHFDKNFADQVGVSAHKDTVALFEKEVNSGTDPDLKAFASKTLPTLQEHLKMAQDLDAQVKQ